MTLVVAKQVRGVTVVVADTKLSPHSGGSWQWTDQANKIICLDDDWAIGFAGNAYVADEAIKRLPQDPRFKDLKDSLLEAHTASRSSDPTDFLLFSVRTQSIHRIANGSCKKQDAGTAWIGDQKGYSVFQHQFHARSGQENAADVRHLSFEPGTRGIQPQIIDSHVDGFHTRLSNSLRGAIDESEVPSVGGFPLTLVLAKGAQTFWPMASGLFSSPAPSIQPSESRDILFGEARTGDFNYEIMVSQEATKNVVALYYPNARAALVFARWEDGIPFGKVIAGVEYAEADSRISKECGVEIWRVKIARKSSSMYTVDTDVPKQLEKFTSKS
jgi:hypothetical protein